MDDLFLKIINKEIPANIIYEDDDILAFEDINPQAPTHILIIPKKHIAKLSDVDISDQKLLGHMLIKASEIAVNLKLDNTFRLVINNGANAGQSVFHLHMHLLSGRSFSWPPG
tara:strand:+ start:8500 stop:8838 length:339 start_codon:yes stop_codon:yes gene_type:complete